ncbi:MAG TPA: serine/threonine-protein kinase [Myxococcaceae bacterium]|nr:serine/threonine-protein kinase [Myxococcaceae bacterium]
MVLDTGRVQYELVRPLGQGHHGELLLTRQCYPGGKGGYEVIKRLNRITREQDLQRLVEEARLSTQLRHPNLVAVHALVGSEAEPCLLMEYVEGSSLDELMRLAAQAGRPLSEAFACYVGAELADALQYVNTAPGVHGQSLAVVHRDVTPHSILVGRHGEVKLMDFGAAYSQLPGRVSSEGDNSDLGSIAYGAPERALMERFDGRADLYSLGLVLFQILSGRHLLGAEARFEAELRSRQLRARGESPSSRRTEGLEELSPRRTAAYLRRLITLSPQFIDEETLPLSEGLRPILRKALAPRPEDRMASGSELAGALKGYLERTWPHYGRLELAAEVESLREAALHGLEETPPRKGRLFRRKRRK